MVLGRYYTSDAYNRERDPVLFSEGVLIDGYIVSEYIYPLSHDVLAIQAPSSGGK